MEGLFEPFRFEFFRWGFAAAGLSGALCGLVGTYVVLRGMSYIGHGLSHAIFGGAVASFVAGINFYLGAGVWGVASTLLIHGVARRRTIGADAAIGVVTTASFAVGVALISRQGSFTRNFEAALFGDVLGVTGGDAAVIAAILAASSAALFFGYRSILFTAFDPSVAEVAGVRTARVDALMALVLAATVVSTMQVLGVTLIAAALVTPPVVARMLTDRFGSMLKLSAILGAASGMTGVYLSFYLDVASGAAVVLVSAITFAGVFLATGRTRSLTLQQGGN